LVEFEPVRPGAFDASLASAIDRTEDDAMRRGSLRQAIASLCVCWLAWCGTPRANPVPLAFGMTPDEASAALGLPLTYHSGPPGSETFIAVGQAGIPGFYPTDHGIALQFRRGRLSGWKKDWQLRRSGPL
jgi:hypothetical protein